MNDDRAPRLKFEVVEEFAILLAQIRKRADTLEQIEGAVAQLLNKLNHPAHVPHAGDHPTDAPDEFDDPDDDETSRRLQMRSRDAAAEGQFIKAAIFEVGAELADKLERIEGAIAQLLDPPDTTEPAQETGDALADKLERIEGAIARRWFDPPDTTEPAQETGAEIMDRLTKTFCTCGHPLTSHSARSLYCQWSPCPCRGFTTNGHRS